MSKTSPSKHSIISGENKAFSILFHEQWIQLEEPLTILTGSKTEAHHFFVRGMGIIWERCVREENPPPRNIKSYLYIICKNEWLSEKRQEKSKSYLNDLSELEASENESEAELIAREQKDAFMKQWLNEAISQASENCKKILEFHIVGQQSLKKIWQQLGFSSYQAIVQAKYNCKKKLGNYIFLKLQQQKKKKKTVSNVLNPVNHEQ